MKPSRRAMWVYPLIVAVAVLWSSLEAVSEEPVARSAEPAEVPQPHAADGRHEAPAGETKSISTIGGKALDTLCVSDESLVIDLRRREQDVIAREKQIAAHESELQERETALTEQMKRLEEIRAQIAGIEATQEKGREERVAKLVETVEKMSPKAAARLISGIDEQLAVTAMSRIETARLAKIMNQIDAEKSSRLSEIMANGRVKKKKNREIAKDGGQGK